MKNRQEGSAYIKERLDRFLANKDWPMLFSDATVEHLATEVSNHIPILLNTAGQRKAIGQRPFQFLKAWTSDENSSKVVKHA